MWSFLTDALFGAAVAGPIGPRRRLFSDDDPRELHPDWWKWCAIAAVMALPLEMLVGSIVLTGIASHVANDDFLMFIGLLFFVAAVLMLVTAVGFVIAAAQLVYVVVTDRASARWLVLAMGVFTLGTGFMLLFIPLPPWSPVSLLVAGAGGCALGVYAPVATGSRI